MSQKRIVVWCCLIAMLATTLTIALAAMPESATFDVSSQEQATLELSSIEWEPSDMARVLYFTDDLNEIEGLDIGKATIKTVFGLCISIDQTTATFEIADGQQLALTYNAGENPFRVGQSQKLYVLLG